MKKIATLFALGVLFFSISFSLSNIKEEQTMPVVSLESGMFYYEVDVHEFGITTKNLGERFPVLEITRLIPKFSRVYEDRIEQKYYRMDGSKSLQENCELMQDRYLFLLSHYGFIHDKQQYEISGIPLSKIIVVASEQEVESKLSKYSIQRTVLE